MKFRLVSVIIIGMIVLDHCGIKEVTEEIKYKLRLVNDGQLVLKCSKIRPKAEGSWFFLSEHIYFAEQESRKIHVFDYDGNHNFIFGDFGWQDENFNAITDIFEYKNKIIVVDGISQKISQFSQKGEYEKILLKLELNGYGNKNRPFISPYCNVHRPDKKSIILSSSEMNYYYLNKLESMTLFRKYTFPDFKYICKGGRLSKVYCRNIKSFQEYHSLYVNDNLYYIEANVPYISVLNKDLRLIRTYFPEGTRFMPISNIFHQDLFRSYDVYPVFNYIYGTSQMKSIFENGVNVAALYQNTYSFENYIKSLYHHHYHAFYGFTDSLNYSELDKDEDEYFVQLFDRTLETYYGEIKLPAKPIGFDNTYIYIPQNPEKIGRNYKINKIRLEPDRL